MIRHLADYANNPSKTCLTRAKPRKTSPDGQHAGAGVRTSFIDVEAWSVCRMLRLSSFCSQTYLEGGSRPSCRRQRQ